MRRSATWTFWGGIGVLLVVWLLEAVGEIIRDAVNISFPLLLPPLVKMFHWGYAHLFVDWAPIGQHEPPIGEIAYIITCFVGLFCLVTGLVWSSQSIPQWSQWLRVQRSTWARRGHGTSASDFAYDLDLIVEEESVDLPDTLEVQISLAEHTAAFSQVAAVLNRIDDPDIPESESGRIAEDFLTSLLDDVATSFQVAANEYRGVYMIPSRMGGTYDFEFVQFGRKGLLKGVDFEWLKAIMTGFIGHKDIGTSTQTVALLDIEGYEGKAIAMMRNEGNFKLALGVIMTRSDGVTLEAKGQFSKIASQFRLVGHLSQVTKFMIESN